VQCCGHGVLGEVGACQDESAAACQGERISGAVSVVGGCREDKGWCAVEGAWVRLTRVG
jgi:hypothetical protein